MQTRQFWTAMMKADDAFGRAMDRAEIGEPTQSDYDYVASQLYLVAKYIEEARLMTASENLATRFNVKLHAGKGGVA